MTVSLCVVLQGIDICFSSRSSWRALNPPCLADLSQWWARVGFWSHCRSLCSLPKLWDMIALRGHSNSSYMLGKRCFLSKPSKNHTIHRSLIYSENSCVQVRFNMETLLSLTNLTSALIAQFRWEVAVNRELIDGGEHSTEHLGRQEISTLTLGGMVCAKATIVAIDNKECCTTHPTRHNP